MLSVHVHTCIVWWCIAGVIKFLKVKVKIWNLNDKERLCRDWTHMSLHAMKSSFSCPNTATINIQEISFTSIFWNILIFVIFIIPDKVINYIILCPIYSMLALKVFSLYLWLCLDDLILYTSWIVVAVIALVQTIFFLNNPLCSLNWETIFHHQGWLQF